MSDRTTTELLVLIGAGAFAIVLITVAIGVVVTELIDPKRDTAAAADFVGHAIGGITAATLGYITGRRVRTREDRE